ncbi:hypothetical protein MY4824_002927 [Beauveria thailandica]
MAAFQLDVSTQSAPAKEIELRRLPGPANNNNHSSSSSSNSDGVNPASTTETRHGNLQLMSRRDTTPEAPAHAASVVPTMLEPYRNRSRLMLTCATALAEGMSNSGAGALIPYGSGIGEKRYVCTSSSSAALVFELLVWLVGNGRRRVHCRRLARPLVYPCATSSFLRGMSHREFSQRHGHDACLWQHGRRPSGRLFVGLLAQVVDTWVRHPIVIVAFIGMLLCWYGIPDEKRRKRVNKENFV